MDQSVEIKHALKYSNILSNRIRTNELQAT